MHTMPAARTVQVADITKLQQSAFCKQLIAMVSCYLKQHCLCINRAFVLSACCAVRLGAEAADYNNEITSHGTPPFQVRSGC